VTTRARLVGLAATLLLLGGVFAVPVALVATTADLVPVGPFSLQGLWAEVTAPDDGTLALRVIAVVAWLSWAVLTLSIVIEVVSRVRGVRPPRIPGMHVPQLAAHQLVAAAALMFVSLSAAPAPAAGQATVPVATVAVAPAPAQSATTLVSAADPEPVAAPPVTYIVQPGDSLSAIARDQLGNLERWPEIVAQNPVVAGNPDIIYAGTVLTLPSAAPSAPGATRAYAVQPGDTLSRIARDQLGDASRWPEIFAASTATIQADGRRITDPDVIDVGQILALPAPPAPADVPTSPPGPRTPTPASPLEVPEEPEPALHTPPGGADESPTAAESAPSHIPAGASQGQTSTLAGEDETQGATSWMLAGLTGGGALLAGTMYGLLARRRRARSRARRPGRTLTAPPTNLAPVERTIAAIGSVTAPTTEHLDAVLRRLASAVTEDAATMPDLAAVQLTVDAVVLHLVAPGALPAPWKGSADRCHWSAPASLPLDEFGHHVADQPAPFPLLATIGSGDDGSMWLFNLEGTDLTLTGDPAFTLDFARYLVADLACNPWSATTTVDCVGIGEELAGINPERVRVHDTNWDAHDDPVREHVAEAVHTIDQAMDAHLDVTTARATQAGAEAWPARLLVVDASCAHPTLDELLDLVRTHPGRTAACVLVHGTRGNDPGMLVELTAEGRLRLPSVGLDLVAVGLTSDEARGCAALLAHADMVEDAEIPVDDQNDDGWRHYSDQAGALRTEFTTPRRATGPGETLDHDVAGSVLAAPDTTYLEAAATTPDDLAALAPLVAVDVRADVEATDPRLDADVAAWFAEDCPLPRLRLLGPVRATTRGTPLVKRKPYMTELLTFIALHPHGVTPAEVAEAFDITLAKVREYVRLVREWLGTNPRTGEPHLPDARFGANATLRGAPVYEVVDLLVDFDLFRRLRTRGQAKGPEGIHDLRTALRLVTGRPFDAPVQRRAGGGWTWLVEGDRLDEHAVVAVVDVAHLVTTHALATGELHIARAGAETATLAGPYEEIPRLDLVAVATAEGNHAEARQILREQIANRSDDDGAPPELSARTEEILGRRTDWLDTTRAS
jgi:LysM repeat protein